MDNEADYTITFRNLSKVLNNKPDGFLKEFLKKEEIIAWLEDWKFALGKENESFESLAIKLDEINPAYIPRNHQIQDAIDQAYESDFSKMLEMIEVIKQPFNERPMYDAYALAPLENQKVRRTFCGT